MSENAERNILNENLTMRNFYDIIKLVKQN